MGDSRRQQNLANRAMKPISLIRQRSMQDRLVTGAHTTMGMKTQQLSPRLNYALKNTQGGVKGNTISLIKQSEANRRAISQSRRSSLAASRQRRLSSMTRVSERQYTPTAPQARAQSGGISPRSRKASARSASNLPTKWKSGDDVLVRESDSSLEFSQGTVLCSSGFKRYTIIMDDASVLVDVTEDSIFPLSSLVDTTKIAKESQIQPPQETIVQEISSPTSNEPQLLASKLQTEPSKVHDWCHSSYVSALSSSNDQAECVEMTHPSLGPDVSLLHIAERHKKHLQVISDKLDQLKKCMNIVSGAGVLVTKPTYFFGHCENCNDQNNLCTVVDAQGNQHHNVSLQDMQLIDIDQELNNQHQELTKQVDCFYPGAHVLVMEVDKPPESAVVLYRNSPYDCDICYRTSKKVVQGMLIQRLVAVPVLKPEPVILSEPLLAIIVGDLEFTIHERVIVPDSSVPGVIVEILSTKFVAVEFDDGEIDQNIPVTELRKYVPVPGLNSHLSDGQLPGLTLFRVGDWVLVTHPSGKRLEKGRIDAIQDMFCDVQFSEGDIVRQIPLNLVQATGSTDKPGCFHLLDYVLVSNPRFERYCTAQITYVNATTNPPIYNIVFDYGEAMCDVPHNYVTTLDDPKVLTPDRRLTNVWDSVLGWEALDVTWFECHGNIALHRMICMHKKPRQTLQVGEPVYARYHDSDKYFLAVIEQLSDKGMAKVVFASTQRVEELPVDKMFSIAPSKPRQFTAPIVTPQRYTLAQRSSQSKLRAPMKPKQDQKPSFLQRLRSFFISHQPTQTRTNPQRTKNTGTRRSSILKIWAK